MQEQRNVKWILIISIIMLPASILMGFALYPYYYYIPRAPDPLTTLALYINRTSTLLFIATITTATLATAGIPRKNTMISVYLFIAAMALLFITMLKLLFTFPTMP